MSRFKAAELGAGLVTAAALAYLLHGDNAQKSAVKLSSLKGWMLKMKGEVHEELEKMQGLSQDAYLKAVDQIADKYSTLQHVDQKDLKVLVAELKEYWKNLEQQKKALK